MDIIIKNGQILRKINSLTIKAEPYEPLVPYLPGGYYYMLVDDDNFICMFDDNEKANKAYDNICYIIKKQISDNKDVFIDINELNLEGED